MVYILKVSDILNSSKGTLERQKSSSSTYCLGYFVTLILHMLSHVDSKQPAMYYAFPCKGETDEAS